MSRVSEVAELLRIRILRGELEPGERVIEVVLAEALHTTRSTLREAMRLLEGRGLLVANESGGMRVVHLDPGALAETLRVRAALEALGAAEAAERRRQGRVGADALRRVEALMDRVDAAASARAPQDAVFADRTFHLGLEALAGNRASHVALDHLWDRILVAWLHAGAGPPATHEHRALLAAIGDGDGEAAADIARRHALVLRGE